MNFNEFMITFLACFAVIMCVTIGSHAIHQAGVNQTKFFFDKDENICYIQVLDKQFTTPCSETFPYESAQIATYVPEKENNKDVDLEN